MSIKRDRQKDKARPPKDTVSEPVELLTGTCGQPDTGASPVVGNDDGRDPIPTSHNLNAPPPSNPPKAAVSAQDAIGTIAPAPITPGPWEWRLALLVSRNNVVVLCPAIDEDGAPDIEVNMADKALIAAAPELLEAAKKFESDLSQYCDGPERDALRAAIAKAEGRTTMSTLLEFME